MFWREDNKFMFWRINNCYFLEGKNGFKKDKNSLS